MKLRFFLFLVAGLLVVTGTSAVAAERGGAGMRVIANVDPVEVGKVGIGTKGLLGSKISQSEAVVVFEPRRIELLSLSSMSH
jgi:hypothetical protein